MIVIMCHPKIPKNGIHSKSERHNVPAAVPSGGGGQACERHGKGTVVGLIANVNPCLGDNRALGDPRWEIEPSTSYLRQGGLAVVV